MAYVKLDCGILDSTTWFDKDGRDIFITALLMATPREIDAPCAQIEIRTLDPAGWEVPAGWYGFVDAASTGIIHRCGIPVDRGLDALERLGSPENESRSQAHDGRRMVRIDGGFLILNYIEYREKDHTAAERQRRYRERQRAKKTDRNGVTSRNITQAEAEAEVEKKDLMSAAPTSVESKKKKTIEDRARERKNSIKVIFDHWKAVWDHPRAKLDQKRRNTITRAMDSYSESDLCQAISGYRNSPHHMGMNDRDTVYDSIELFLRDAKHIDAGLKFYESPPDPKFSKATRENISRTIGWRPIGHPDRQG